MNPGLDRQGRRNQWPWPVDTPTDRARKIANMYRAQLRALNRSACDILDDTCRDFGETWMLDKEDLVKPDDELTTTQAAELVNATPKRIREWACLDHPDQPGQPLLPRFKMRGRERTYLAQHVLAAAATMGRRRIGA